MSQKRPWYSKPDQAEPAKEEAWNKAYSACKTAKSKLGKVVDELEEKHPKLVAHGPQSEADEVGPKIETLRKVKLPELTQLGEEATSHLAATTAYNKKLTTRFGV